MLLSTYTLFVSWFHDKSALPNQRLYNSAYDDSALQQIGAKTNRRNDKSAQRQIGATTNRRNDKSALMSNNQNIKYQQSAQNEEARLQVTSLVIAESEVMNT
jgi:hypothetical protein